MGCHINNLLLYIVYYILLLYYYVSPLNNPLTVSSNVCFWKLHLLSSVSFCFACVPQPFYFVFVCSQVHVVYKRQMWHYSPLIHDMYLGTSYLLTYCYYHNYCM